MGRPGDDFDLLLTAANQAEAQLAEGVLAAAGIPAFLHVSNWLGRAPNDERLLRPRVYVPPGALEHAGAVLDEAWGSEWRKRSDAVTPHP